MLNRLAILLCSLLLTASHLHSQPKRPKISGTLPQGYYFMTPYKINQQQQGSKFPLMVFNEMGEVVFYQYVELASDFKIHKNGIISYASKSKIYFLKDNFVVYDSIECINKVKTDPHDFLILNNGHYLLLGYEFKTRNYRKHKIFLKNKTRGSRYAKVKYGVIQEFDEQKKLVFNWSTARLFNGYGVDPFYLYDSLNVDLTHLNSVDIDDNGDMIVSSKYFNEVFKLQKSDSQVVWRMGGKKNGITFLNDNVPFLGQHDARFTGTNTFSIFDNGFYTAPLKHNARAIEYLVDDSAKTAKVVWSYTNPKRILSEGNGNVQSLPNQLMLINYGKITKNSTNITFEVVDKTNNKQLAAVHFKDTMGTYRTFYYPSLPFKLVREEIAVTNQGGKVILSLPNKHAFYKWSTGEKTSRIFAKKKGVYFVYYSDDGKRFFGSPIFNF